MSEENCSESDVSVSCRYSSRVKKYLRIINSAVSNFIPKKSKRHGFVSNIKMTLILTAVVKSKGTRIARTVAQKKIFENIVSE
jgi:hypothetical protein